MCTAHAQHAEALSVSVIGILRVRRHNHRCVSAPSACVCIVVRANMIRPCEYVLHDTLIAHRTSVTAQP